MINWLFNENVLNSIFLYHTFCERFLDKIIDEDYYGWRAMY